MLGPTEYLLSISGLVLAIASLALAATRLRGRVLVGWSGPPALLADAVITLALLIWIAELLGVFAGFTEVALIGACIAVGLGVRLTIPPLETEAGRPPPAPSPGRWARPVAGAIAAVVLAHWLIGTAAALGGGMTGYDSAWYHMPFAAHFAQTGSSLSFDYVSPRYLAWFYPQNSELLHAVGLVTLHRDLLSPLLNLVWLGGCLGAAWCVGRPYGKGAWTLAGAAVVLDAGVMGDQAGQARNDTLGLFFLLAAVALLVNGAAASADRRPGLGPLAIAGLATGLAAGVKLSFLAPALALLLASPLAADAGRRTRALVSFGIPLLAGCGFWYLRNFAVADNPLPWLKSVGPLHLGGPQQGLGGKPQFSFLDYLGDSGVWTHWFEPALSHRLGELWPLVLVVAVVALLSCLLRGERIMRLVALAAAAAAVAYLVDGTTAEGPPGVPNGFASSLRHLIPGLAVALVLLPLAPGLGSRRGRVLLGSMLAVLLLAADLSAPAWRPGYLLVAATAAVAILSLPLVRPWQLRSLPQLRSGFAALAAVIALVLAGGWFLQRSYLNERYDGDEFKSAGLDAAFKWASTQRDRKIATTLPIQYPLMGPDLSNRVTFIGNRRAEGGFTLIRGCRRWREQLFAGGYQYVLTAGGVGSGDSGRSHCLATHPGAKPVLAQRQIVVYRLQPGGAEKTAG